MENDSMRIELLHIDECPNTREAQARLESALANLGHSDIPVNLRLVAAPADMAGSGFAGSPTITVNGADIFPAGAPADDLACRIYRTPAGLAGLPTLGQITEALKKRGL
ncbi:MAG TPA: thioredoxin family protein [Arthrobacter sp.]